MADIPQDDVAAILPILKQVPLLEELNEEDHRQIIPHISLELYPREHIIFHEGDVADAFYIIKSGMVRIFHENPQPEQQAEVAMLADNDFFGEMAFISEKPRNASAQAVEETQCFKLLKEDFMELITTNPHMAGHISSEFLKRYKMNMRTDQDSTS